MRGRLKGLIKVGVSTSSILMSMPYQLPVERKNTPITGFNQNCSFTVFFSFHNITSHLNNPHKYIKHSKWSQYLRLVFYYKIIGVSLSLHQLRLNLPVSRSWHSFREEERHQDRLWSSSGNTHPHSHSLYPIPTTSSSISLLKDGSCAWDFCLKNWVMWSGSTDASWVLESIDIGGGRGYMISRLVRKRLSEAFSFN